MYEWCLLLLTTSLRPGCLPRSAAVVGAGPAGLATAAVLAERGWAVTVLERRTEAKVNALLKKHLQQ